MAIVHQQSQFTGILYRGETETFQLAYVTHLEGEEPAEVDPVGDVVDEVHANGVGGEEGEVELPEPVGAPWAIEGRPSGVVGAGLGPRMDLTMLGG